MAVAKPARGASWTMFLAAHRAGTPRRRRIGRGDRVLVFTPDAAVRLRIEHELFGERVAADYVDTLVDLVAILTLVPPPWPQLLVVDADAVSRIDLELVGAIRGAGWPGMVISIGEPSTAMRTALGVDVVLPHAFECEALRRAIRHVGAERPTIPMRRTVR